MSAAPALVLTCPACGREKPLPGALDVDMWHPVDCAANPPRQASDHRFWWRRRSNPVPGEEPLLEYSTLDPGTTPDPKTVH